jgi:large subunit ribosomal protein L19
MSDTIPVIKAIEQRHMRGNLPDFRVGDTVRVFVKIKEGDKERVQAFEGVCIKRTRNAVRGTFTVRKISYGVGVERVFPFNSPMLDKVDVASRGRVRRARLFYLRDLQGKKARIREKSDLQTGPGGAPAGGEVPQA